MTSQARINPNGSLDLPADMLKRLGIGAGAEVMLEEIPGGIRIRLPVEEIVRRAQAISREILGDRAGMAVDDFLAERRSEAAIE